MIGVTPPMIGVTPTMIGVILLVKRVGATVTAFMRKYRALPVEIR
jgi:hypothetical protein